MIVDYPIVLERMEREGFRSLYHNSGAFGFVDEVGTESVGWIGEADETLKPAARLLARQVAQPIEENLTKMAVRVWQEFLPGPVWVMPKSHWAYELEFGSREWMGTVLEKIGIEVALLTIRNNAAAIEFAADETEQFQILLKQLLTKLASSDFFLAFPGRRTICTVHNHKQLWWTTGDELVCRHLKSR